MRYPVLLTALITIIFNSSDVVLGAYENVDKQVEVVNALCLSGTQYFLELDAEGHLLFKKMVPGGAASVMIDSRKAPGATGYFNEEMRLIADKNIIECTQKHIPRILDEISRTSLSNPKQEVDLDKDARSDDPAKRALAFRRAFASLTVFRLDLEPSAPPPRNIKVNSADYEYKIASPVGYYNAETGEFREKERATAGFRLMGYLNGDNIVFQKRSCSGALANVSGTWTFRGTVSCASVEFVGQLSLR